MSTNPTKRSNETRSREEISSTRAITSHSRRTTPRVGDSSPTSRLAHVTRRVPRVASVLFLLAACDPSLRDLTWRYDTRALDEPTSLEARIREGGCDGAIVFEDRFAIGATGALPDRLRKGTYGFELLARDADCAEIGRGCVELALPTDDPELVVVLAPSTGPACDGVCADGLCVPSTPDGGPNDAGPLDGGARDDASCTDCPCEDCDAPGDRCESGVCIPAIPATDVEVGTRHTCALAGERLYCWGQSGLFETGRYLDPMTYAAPSAISGRWSALEIGSRSICAKRVGVGGEEIVCWGSNNRDQLGLGDEAGENVGTTVQPADLAFDQITLGLEHGLAILDGTLYGWGTNSHFQLSNLIARGTTIADPTAMTLDGITGPFAQVSAMQWSSFVRHEDGRAWGFGWSAEGENGSGRSSGSFETPGALPGDDWIELQAGMRHACGRTGDGSVFCWGHGEMTASANHDCDDMRGALGDGTGSSTMPSSPIADLTASREGFRLSAWCGSCVIDDDDALHCFGANTYGELGVGDREPRLRPARVEGTWIDVALGERHACAIRTGGALYCWGSNADGRLGHPTADDEGFDESLVPRRVVLPE
jgi:hypothetical protein